MPSPEEMAAAAREFLADHPEAAEPLAALVERDARGEPWEFADTDLDSGRFGELVGRDLATSVDDGYRLRNPDAIRSALDATTEGNDTDTDPDPTETTDEAGSLGDRVSAPGSAVTGADGRTLLGLVGALFAVAAARLVAAPAVLRDGYVVSPGNDTYFFRYWQERLAAQADGLFDVGLLADMGGAASTRPLSHAINAWVTLLAGGVDAAPTVAAWLPVVAAVCLGIVVYQLTHLLTNDVRVSLAAVLFYGLAPANVVYTSVGFLDHQAHQYLWLGALALALTALAVDVARRARETDPAAAVRAHASAPRSWAIAAGLAVTVAASTHLWGGSPLTFVPVAAVIGLRVVLDVRHDASPALGTAPLLTGIGVGAALALAAHLSFGWHEPIAAATPALVTLGGIGVVAVGELWRRTDLPAIGLVAMEALVAAAGLLGYWALRPGDFDRLQTRAGDLFFREGISETVSLFSPDFAVVFGPLLQLGLGFYFAVAVLAVATWAVARRYEPGWLVLVTFAWYYTLLATIQVRFAGQLAIFVAPFAGIGVVYLLAAIDVARPVAVLGRAGADDTASTRRGRLAGAKGSDDDAGDRGVSDGPDRGISTLRLPDGTQKRGYLVGAIAVVLLFNLILVPSLVGQTTHDRAQFDAALMIDDHADETDREHPQNFVLSRWDDNRMYNYFVSGESQGYGYARNNHDPFLAAEDPDSWYDRFEDRVGYVVVTDRENAPTANTTYGALHDGLGVGANGTSATGHYQLLAADEGVRTFAVVPGATLRVSDVTGEQVSATTTVSVGNDTYEYTRRGAVENGTATVRVAHPGEYRIANRTVTVTDDDVVAGNRTTVSPT